MLSFPGPLPPLNKEKLMKKDIVARKYRNRRIGDFLKELHLAEGRGTGIPKIINAMQKNGSPEPIFETDDNLSYFLVTLFIHPELLRKQDKVQAGVQAGVQGKYRKIDILEYCLRPKKKKEILAYIGLSNKYKNFQRHIKPLIQEGLLIQTIPDKPTSENQQYRTTTEGEKVIETLRNSDV